MTRLQRDLGYRESVNRCYLESFAPTRTARNLLHLGHNSSRGVQMPDTKRRGSPDSERINVNQEHELRDWSKLLGVTPERLKAAVQEVGPSAEAVRELLKGKK